MSEARDASPFSPKTAVALVLVGIFAFSGFTVLSVYAPDLRSGRDGGAHALSTSADGFAGAVVLLKAQGVPVVVSRSPLTKSSDGGLLRVLTPSPETGEQELRAYDRDGQLLVVLPKWAVSPHLTHAGWVRKVNLIGVGTLLPLKRLGAPGVMYNRSDNSSVDLRSVADPFGDGTYLPVGKVDRLQTIMGGDWRPILVDQEGRSVLARWGTSSLVVLADPDLLNTQGLKSLDKARAGLAILKALRGDDGVAFDVSLNGFKRSRSVLRLMFEPPLVGATLCLLAMALLMGLHATARFGPTLKPGRAFALGKRALIDNSADLIRAARKEHELTGAYANLIQTHVAKMVGDREIDPAQRVTRLSRLEAGRQTSAKLIDLTLAAAKAAGRGESLSVAAKLFQWKSEMTRDRR